jgi:uncharacterized Zn finger protein
MYTDMNQFLRCPACMQEGEHEILKESHDLLVRCMACGQIYHTPAPRIPTVIQVKTVISQETESQVGTVELLDDEECRIGDLLVAEIGEDVVGVEITGIEVGPRRMKKAKASEIAALWTRMVEKVVIKVSVHDKRVTHPLYFECDGEEDFVIGEIRTIQGLKFRVQQIKLRNGSVMRKEGWKAWARKIKRVYGTRL